MHLKNRLAIFCFYDIDGIVDSYIEYLLQDLKSCITRLIIVANGILSENGKRKFERYTDEIIIRENRGYDLGAYKEILTDYLDESEIEKFDEIVLCNDTFYGPFIPFKDIFQEMNSRVCDFWGLGYGKDRIANHVQAYFLVFGRSVIRNGYLLDYMKNIVDEYITEINCVYVEFECGLLYYLVSKGMIFDSYLKQIEYDVYRSSYICMKIYNLPFIKKRAFSKRFYNEANIMGSLKLIKETTNYDTRLILQSISRIYGLNISRHEIEHYQLDQKKIYNCQLNVSKSSSEEIKEFINHVSQLYIYGAGFWACRIYWLYCQRQKHFKGFVISDTQQIDEETVYGHPVIHLSDIKNLKSAGIIVGLSKQYTPEVYQYLDQVDQVLYLF